MEVLEKRSCASWTAPPMTLCDGESTSPCVVFDMLFEEGNIERVVRGDSIGTLIRS